MCSSSDWGEFYLFLMTFPLQFNLLMIGVCTLIQKQKTKKKQKKKEKKKEKKKSAKICLCLISYFIDFLLLGSSLGV